MPEQPEHESTTRPTFGTSLRGYARDDVDAYLTTIERQNQQLIEELKDCRATASNLKRKLDELGAHSAESDALQAEAESLREAYERIREEYARLRAEHDEMASKYESARAEVEALRGESDRIQRVLLIAHKTAEEIHAKARAEAEQTLREAEARAVRVDEEARTRMRDLSFEFEQAKRDFDEFLSNARNLAHSFIRKIDETRSHL